VSIVVAAMNRCLELATKKRKGIKGNISADKSDDLTSKKSLYHHLAAVADVDQLILFLSSLRRNIANNKSATSRRQYQMRFECEQERKQDSSRCGNPLEMPFVWLVWLRLSTIL
jgi:hypothetical protein